ncbi:hypothetical protein P152DRAFT_242513 [Eremomyces bilateralis CBS 781.70]|uniref:C2H2-type domain-containing protein n=1 Tax=Eremomyces bilateralis CBS 781.70 TaxID=1392243 RepID=A0A6G1GAB5_9PEZI|nr:uncharacterized protein P152DRAFT_242513 [Eremomyces bilateralis CBS 781.70]KAF1815018.1 hypothetical protein P152DRAFT_242513 [Eremomyces bilateralis CBS 781.70]
MAATTRAITPTHSGHFTSTSAAPSTPDSIISASHLLSNEAKPASDPLNSITTGSISTSIQSTLSPKTAGFSRFSPMPLTGAPAMEDEHRREQQAQERARQKSPNANLEGVNALIGHNATKPSDVSDSATTSIEPLIKVAIAAEGAQNEQESHPTNIEGLTTTAPATTAGEAISVEASVTDPALETPQGKISGDMLPPSAQTDHSARAHTYPSPFPPDSEQRGPPRNMSLPVAGYNPNSPKSPSTKRHKCPYCSTDFTRHHNLKSHLLTHSQEKPYECSTCQARFRRLHDLKRHTKLHTGERPHTCQRCGRKFARGDALARHNKGPGGCAGRRTSFTISGEDDSIMEGLEYHHQQTAEPDGMDEDEEGAPDRRLSESGPKHVRAPSTDEFGRLHPGSSYPPPPNALVSNASISPGGSGIYPARPHDPSSNARDPSIHPSFPPGHQSSVFSQSMIDSPRPLSPGQVAASQTTTSTDPARNNMYARSTNGSQGFPPPSTIAGPSSGNKAASGQHLPSISSLGSTSGPTDPRILAASTGPVSNPSSMSSHGAASSGASLRELIGATRDDAAVQGMMNGKIQELETRMARMQEDYEGRIKGLTQEIGELKRQLSERDRGR